MLNHQMNAETHKMVSAHRSWLRSERPRRQAEDEEAVLRILANSVEYRLRSVRYHLHMIEDLHAEAARLHRENPDRDQGHRLLRELAEQLNYLFDDLIFNAISLFDYMGCLIGLVCQGLDAHQIDWAKGIGTAKSSPESASLSSILSMVDRPFVRTLTRYRSEVSHFRRDQLDGHVTFDLLGNGGDDLHVTLPRWFSKVVRFEPGEPTPWAGDESIVATATALVEKAEAAAKDVLEALGSFCGKRENVAPVESVEVLTGRWSRDGLFDMLATDPTLVSLGVSRVGACVVPSGISFIAFLGDRQVETEVVPLSPLAEWRVTSREAVERFIHVIRSAIRRSDSHGQTAT